MSIRQGFTHHSATTGVGIDHWSPSLTLDQALSARAFSPLHANPTYIWNNILSLTGSNPLPKYYPCLPQWGRSSRKALTPLIPLTSPPPSSPACKSGRILAWFYPAKDNEKTTSAGEGRATEAVGVRVAVTAERLSWQGPAVNASTAEAGKAEEAEAVEVTEGRKRRGHDAIIP